jgi:hypothetical protein
MTSPDPGVRVGRSAERPTGAEAWLSLGPAAAPVR